MAAQGSASRQALLVLQELLQAAVLEKKGPLCDQTRNPPPIPSPKAEHCCQPLTQYPAHLLTQKLSYWT